MSDCYISVAVDPNPNAEEATFACSVKQKTRLKMQKTLSKRSPWAQKAIRIIKKRDAIEKGEEEEEEEEEEEYHYHYYYYQTNNCFMSKREKQSSKSQRKVENCVTSNQYYFK